MGSDSRLDAAVQIGALAARLKRAPDQCCFVTLDLASGTKLTLSHFPGEDEIGLETTGNTVKRLKGPDVLALIRELMHWLANDTLDLREWNRPAREELACPNCGTTQRDDSISGRRGLEIVFSDLSARADGTKWTRGKCGPCGHLWTIREREDGTVAERSSCPDPTDPRFRKP